MSRIFVPVESVTIAHVVRPLEVAKALRERGAEVVFGMNDRFRSVVEKEGFEVRNIYGADHRILLNAVRTLDFKQQIACLPRYLEADIAAIESMGGVDLVLSDFRFTIRLAAEHLEIPHVALTNGYYSSYYDVLPEVPEAFSGFMPGWIKRSRRLRRFLKNRVPRWNARPYRDLCRRYALETEIESCFDIAVSKTLTLLCDLPEFTPQRNLPPHYQFVGPILWEPVDNVDRLPEHFDGRKRPLVYVTMGTSGEDGALRTIIDAFKDSMFDVVITTGSKTVQPGAPNIFVTPFIRASDVLKRASLMICHGGNGSIYQALNQAVPVLCVTTFYDQEWNGQRVRELGLGETLFHRRLNAATLPYRCERIMENAAIRENVRKFRTMMEQWRGAELAAEKIMNLAGVYEKV